MFSTGLQYLTAELEVAGDRALLELGLRERGQLGHRLAVPVEILREDEVVRPTRKQTDLHRARRELHVRQLEERCTVYDQRLLA